MNIPDGATLVIRRLTDGFTVETLTRLWHGVAAEGVTIQHTILSPTDFTCYGNLLTGIKRWGEGAQHHPIEEADNDPRVLGIFGCAVRSVASWPRGTIGFVVLREEGQDAAALAEALRLAREDNAALARSLKAVTAERDHMVRHQSAEEIRLSAELQETRTEVVRLAKQVEDLDRPIFLRASAEGQGVGAVSLTVGDETRTITGLDGRTDAEKLSISWLQKPSEVHRAKVGKVTIHNATIKDVFSAEPVRIHLRRTPLHEV